MTNYGEWLPVPGIDKSTLLVSSEGWIRVRIKSRGGIQALGPPQRGSATGNGTLRCGVGGKTYLVHRLIAFAFLGPPPSSSHTVDHINRDPTDNRVSNLRWASRSEQTKNQGKRCVQRSAKPVELVSPSGETHRYESALAAARAIGANPGNVSNSASRGWSVNGYKAHFVFEEYQGDLVIDGEVEQWAEVAECPRLSVSTMGRIQWRHYSGTVGLRKTPEPNARLAGYCFVHINDKDVLVHRLVLETFSGLPKDVEKCTVDHINHVRHDNRLSNLRWASMTEQRSNRSTSEIDPRTLPLAPQDVSLAHRKQYYRRDGIDGVWMVRHSSQRSNNLKWVRAKCRVKESSAVLTEARSVASCQQTSNVSTASVANIQLEMLHESSGTTTSETCNDDWMPSDYEDDYMWGGGLAPGRGRSTPASTGSNAH